MEHLAVADDRRLPREDRLTARCADGTGIDHGHPTGAANENQSGYSIRGGRIKVDLAAVDPAAPGNGASPPCL